MAISCLWIDDELEPDDALLRYLRLEGIDSEVARMGWEGLRRAQFLVFDSIVLDLRLPDAFGMTLLSRLRASSVRSPIIMSTAYYLEPEVEEEAFKQGAAAFLRKPIVDPDGLVRLLQSLVRRTGGNPVPSRLPAPRHGIIAASAAMKEIVSWIERIGSTTYSVLITGETGTGKERVARAIHDTSERRHGPFVPVNCAAIVESLAETELFGHRRGAFTGAEADTTGLFDAAHQGTLFLDEIGELPLRTQAQLLRVLDTGELRRVGAPRATRVDVRLVAATNRRLVEDARYGSVSSRPVLQGGCRSLSSSTTSGQA